MNYNIIVYSFIIILILYIVLNYNNIAKLDLYLIVLSIICLFINNKNNIEGFHNDDIDNYQKINLEEDILSISTNLVLYNTCFNDLSYNLNNGVIWKDISSTKNISNFYI